MRTTRQVGAAQGFWYGVRLLGRGAALYARTPYLLVLGLIPVLVAAVLFVAAFATLLYFLDELATGATWFAGDWPETARNLAVVLAGVAIVGVALLVGVLAFTAFTLAIGDPFYERISREVEDRCGGGPAEVDAGFWRSLGTSVADSARMLAIAAMAGVVLFLAGLLPAVGQTVVPVLGVVAGGWFLAVELVGIPFSRRGLRLRDRWRALRAHRPVALGFGSAVFVCFLVPGAVVLVIPAAVAGGTLLARRVLGLPDRYSAGRPAATGPG